MKYVVRYSLVCREPHRGGTEKRVKIFERKEDAERAAAKLNHLQETGRKFQFCIDCGFMEPMIFAGTVSNIEMKEATPQDESDAKIKNPW